MAERILHGIELLPESGAVRQLFILLHGVGARSGPGSARRQDQGRVSRRSAAAAGCSLAIRRRPAGWRCPPVVPGQRRERRKPGSTCRRGDAGVACAGARRTASLQFNVLQSDIALVGFSQVAKQVSSVLNPSDARRRAFSSARTILPVPAPPLTANWCKNDRSQSGQAIPKNKTPSCRYDFRGILRQGLSGRAEPCAEDHQHRRGT